MESKALPEGKYLDIDNGLRLHYHEQGEGLPVIFIHGSGQGASGFSNFCQNENVNSSNKVASFKKDPSGMTTV